MSDGVASIAGATSAMGTTSAVRAPSRPSFVLAATVSVALCAFFIAVYHPANWLASTRSDVGTWRFGWERWIPFVPLMIVPYMSIDALFVAAPFLCRDRGELRLLARRIVLAIAVAGVCFLLMPLQLAVERPVAEGALGVVFERFKALDKPFNLCPSLHIALRTILAELYHRRTRGAMRVVSDGWFSLIGLSTLLTYQHHVIDVAGGFALAAVVFWYVSPAPWRVATEGNVRVGGWYALGAATLAGAAMGLHARGGWVLWWPAAVLGLVAAAYLMGARGPGGGIFRKFQGRVPLGARIVLAPARVGQWLSWRHYATRSEPWSAVTNSAGTIWMGRVLRRDEAERAVDGGVVAVVDLTAEFSAPRAFARIAYLNIALLDLTAPTPEQLDRALAFIDDHARRGIVYVHCKAGYSRSATVVGAWLMRHGAAGDTRGAIEMIRAARPEVVVRPEAVAALERFSRRSAAVPSPAMITMGRER